MLCMCIFAFATAQHPVYNMLKGNTSFIDIICDPISAAGPEYNPEGIPKWGKRMYFCVAPCRDYTHVITGNEDYQEGSEYEHVKSWDDREPLYPHKMFGPFVNAYDIVEEGRTKLKLTIKGGWNKYWNAAIDWKGTFYCAWEITGKDIFTEPFEIQIVEPLPNLLTSVIEDNEQEEERKWFSDRVRAGRKPEDIHAAEVACEGNKACMLALLQRQTLNVTKPCWWCLQMSRVWQVTPLTKQLTKALEGEIPCDMTDLINIQVSEEITGSNTACIHPTQYRAEGSTKGWLVKPRKGEVCVCRLEQNDSTVNVGHSHCSTEVEFDDTESVCWQGDKEIACPVDVTTLHTTTAATVWVCGSVAYHVLPADWRGCCYPAILDVGTTIYVEDETSPMEHRRQKRELGEGMPYTYQGAKLWSPWTSKPATVGWALFPSGGTGAALMKINGLAWEVLRLANETQDALALVNKELKAIREMVLQNRLALDMLTAEKGGVCKLLKTSCCFSLPDVSQNVSNIIEHMKSAVKTPGYMSDPFTEWYSGLNDMWQWLVSTVLPVGVGILLILMLVPCLIKCVGGTVNNTVRSVGDFSHTLARIDTTLIEIVALNNRLTDDEEDDDDDDEPAIYE